jgi:alpha-amylase
MIIVVNACHSVGVGVFVDAITNHMTGGNAQGKGFGGSPYKKYDYPLFKENNFHKCGGSVALDITNYADRYNAQFCEQSGLADLAHEQDYVRDTIAAYFTDLQSLGVDGFRMDSSVQQPASNLSDIFAMLPHDYYATFEVDGSGGNADAVKQSEYWDIGATMAFAGTNKFQSACESTGIAELATAPMGPKWGKPVWADAQHTNLFVTNHDKERQGSSLTTLSPNNAYVLANIFMLAFNYGSPEVYSSFDISDGDLEKGAPQDAQGLTKPVECNSADWKCQHRWWAISNMVGFHNKAASSDLTNVQQGSSQQIAFGRGGKGFVAINNSGSSWSKTFKTGLPAGSYCDIIHDADSGSCATKITVDSNGQATLNVGSYDAIAFYQH